MRPPSQQVQRHRGRAVVRLPMLRTDGLARLRILIGDGVAVDVKPVSYGEEWTAATAQVTGDTVVLDLTATGFGQPPPSGRSSSSRSVSHSTTPNVPRRYAPTSSSTCCRSASRTTASKISAGCCGARG
jgi:hypothetical protein